jgi:uncharacterized membrane protein HdeD (DUF308 family)
MTTPPLRREHVLPTIETRAWGWFVGVGAALALLGLIASTNLILATLAATYAVGAMMFAGGIVQLVHAFGVRRRGWIAFWIVSGLLYLAAAASVIYDPLFAAGLLTLFLAVSLGASGLARTGIALGWRSRGWGWMLASSIVSIAAALVIALGWPINPVWMLGLVLAIDLWFQGVMLMLIGFTLRQAKI